MYVRLGYEKFKALQLKLPFNAHYRKHNILWTTIKKHNFITVTNIM